MAAAQVEWGQTTDRKLKHLEFARIIAIYVLFLATNLYITAKQNSSSLKSTVDAAEDVVSAVFGPVYERIKGISTHLLFFFDTTLDQTAQIFDETAPAAAKNVATKAQQILKAGSQIAYDLAEEAKVSGPRSAVARAAKISKHFAVRRLAAVWYRLNQYQIFRGVSTLAIPIASNCSDKYNNLVRDMRGKGYNLFIYAPLIPVKLMTKAYKQVQSAERKKIGDKKNSTESGSDME